jgi:hypothetical protein
MTTQLHPSLTLIRNNLFPQDDDYSLAPNTPSLEEDAAEQTAGDHTVEDTVTEIPQHIREFFRRRVEARDTKFSLKPKAGQIVFAKIAHSLTVLLLKPVENNVWQGLVCSSDVDYASYWDILLEEEDEPCDPVVSMIQTWNPVQVYIPETGDVVAELSESRLQAIQATMREHKKDSPPLTHMSNDTRPGYVEARTTLHNHIVVTGAPLGGPDDPRREYQQMLTQVAQTLCERTQSAIARGINESTLAAIVQALFDRFKQAAADLNQPLPVLAPNVAYALSDKAPLKTITWGHLKLLVHENTNDWQLICEFTGNENDLPCTIHQQVGALPTNTFTLDSANPTETLYITQGKKGLLALQCGHSPKMHITLPLFAE